MAPLHTRLPLLGAAVVFTAQPLWANLVSVSQTRSVDSSAQVNLVTPPAVDADTLSAPDFALFDAAVSSSAFQAYLPAVFVSVGDASQKSSIGLNGFSALGSAGVSLTLLSNRTGSAGAEGLSYFQYEFTVTTAKTFSLWGSVDSQSIVTGGASIPQVANELVFEDVVNNVVLFSTLTDDEAFSVNGTLAPGTYRVTASSEISALQVPSASLTRTVSGLGSFDFRFRAQNVPESGTGSAVILVGALGGLSVIARRRRSSEV